MKPLEGITVLEFSTMITASFAAMMMAEQGARVIKVEPMNVGDPMRYIGANKGGISSLFANCNRGKQSIRVNHMLSDVLRCSQILSIHSAPTANLQKGRRCAPQRGLQ